MQAAEIIEFENGMQGEIFHDEDAESPREWDNLGTMACSHRRYTLGDKEHKLRWDDYGSWDEAETGLIKEVGPCVILPMYMLDHSGLRVSTTDFNDRWDSGQIGFIYVTYEKLREEFGWKRMSPQRVQKVYKYLEGEVETYDQYLSGDVWGYVLKDADGEDLDSCWGFFGFDYCKEELESSAKVHMEEAANEKD